MINSIYNRIFIFCIAGDAMVVESAHTLETIKTLEKHNPKALTLLDDDGKTVVFRVGTTTGKGNINAYGASFGSASKNADKKAIITILTRLLAIVLIGKNPPFALC